MEDGGDGKGKRRIKLFCPSVSKIVQISARDEQKLDLGSIARAFGLDPNTLKLNGHFISRGVDLIASSVTWKSLIGFFSARGLSTGATDSDALVVGGKLCKIGPKRSHCVEDAGEGIVNTNDRGYFRENKRPHREHCSVVDKEKGNWSNSDLINRTTGSGLKRKWLLGDESELKRAKFNSYQAVTGSHCVEDDAGEGIVNTNDRGYFRENKRPHREHCSVLDKEKDNWKNSDLINRTTGSGLKRKWLLGDESELKRTKSNSYQAVTGLERKAGVSTNSGFSCSFISENMKRTRDGEMVDGCVEKIR